MSLLYEIGLKDYTKRIPPDTHKSKDHSCLINIAASPQPGIFVEGKTKRIENEKSTYQ